VIAHLSWPEHDTRLAFGLENTLAHTIVDRSLGYERFAGEERLQVTPVEWGILTFAAARSLVELGEPRGLILDRVGPEPFSIDDLGPIVTLRWSVRIGPHVGSARFWVPEPVLETLLGTVADGDRPGHDPATLHRRFKTLGTTWHAVVGTVSRPAGFDLMNMVFPLDQTGLSGTVAAPVGPLELVAGDFSIPAEFRVEGAGRSVTVTGPLARRSASLETHPMSNIPPAPTDVPVTLTVELGKISLPLDALADLQPGMTLSLARHAREPVELTSSGRLVARGELIQIDDVLGVRILNVLL
jgi:flagellar motor switch protein FliN/FliY